MMQSRSRATLSYRPQANGQQERSVKTMIQTVRIYVEDPLQADWDDIVEKLVHAINNSRDSTRQETPFYLVHGCDARSTLKDMNESIRQGQTNSAETSDAAEWRREANRQREVDLYLAAEFQRKEKARRAKEHNEALSRVEKEAVPRSVESPVESAIAEGTPTESEIPEEPSAESPAESTRSLFKEGDQAERLDFDEQILPEDSWEPDEDEDKYEVEAILDDELPLSTSTARAQRMFKVKWVGYDEPSWEPLSNLSCGGLLFDYLRNKKRENRLQMV
ncbi:unnamed protein product [Phytophthora fragariaefolia]|uniref:Unnamed protein product n=1 Tax=Phytophthora fragariaefolia TaxID=1490495 RepID=A0A9W7D568_9STRA|nr:unnamed protein product [Phytophthora fragariaefolia]